MKKTEFLDLIAKITDGTATDRELALFEAYFQAMQADTEDWNTEQSGNKDQVAEELLVRIKSGMEFQPVKVTRLVQRKYWMVAAAIFMVFTVGLYFYSNEIRDSNARQTVQADIKPGGNKAELTLADGSRITLDQAGNGDLVEQAGVQITKTKEGELVYVVEKAGQVGSNRKLAFNTIETPRGGQYQVILPDGTKVWLNAASSLKYPVQFSSNERRVMLSGEGYFEVAKDKERPFKVETPTQAIEVLGTHFNVNAYVDEDFVRTTLLEGRVKVSKGKASGTLSPGQESAFNGTDFIISNVNAEEAIAWKNGYFLFNNNDVEMAMRKISLWYNVDVVYQGNLKHLDVGGRISRSKTLNELIKILELTRKIKLKLEGRTLTVMP